MEDKKMPYAIDLFCGAGGCSEGLIQAGFDIVFSSDISEMAEATYTNRHSQLGLIQGYNTWFEREDVRNLTGDFIWEKIHNLRCFEENNVKIPTDIDLIMGGPCCQGFSRAGKRDKSDPRNMLFGEYVRVINEVKPKYVVLENVEGFMDMQFVGYKGIDICDEDGNVIEEGPLYADGSVTPDILKNELKRVGYHTLEPKILNAADYGVPQRRNRVIFIAYRDGQRVPSYPAPITGQHLTLKDAIGDCISDKTIRCRVNSKETQYQKDSKNGRTPAVNGKPIGVSVNMTNIELPKVSKIVEERFSLFEQGESGSNLRKRIETEGIDISEKKNLVKFCADKLELSPRKVINLFKKAKASSVQIDMLLTKKNIRQRWNENEPAATILSIPDDYISPWESRTFSVREMARCQSFDDSFVFLGKRTTGGKLRRIEVPQYTQVGNAVPPLLAKAIVEQIKKVL